MSIWPRFDIGQQPFQAGPLHVAAREAAIVIDAVSSRPALVPLAHDKGFAGFALGIEGVESLLQALLGGFARIDRAAQKYSFHDLGPKNNGPDHGVPVISRAMAVRLR